MAEPELDLVSEARALLADATPVPWFYSQRTPNLINIYAIGGRGSIADVSRWEGGIAGDEKENRSNAYLIARAPTLISAMADEIERLRRGDFTSDEFQNLCHNTKIQDGFEAFADGCEAYQQKMFGRCRTKGKVL